MPLFGKRDDAENRFKVAGCYVSPTREEFDLSSAIHLLEEAIALRPDRKKYYQELDEVRRIKSKIITSSSYDYQRPKDVYLFLLHRLQAGGEGFVTFRCQGERVQWVQVLLLSSKVSQRTLVASAYPHDEDPHQLLPKLGVSFPAGYVLHFWHRRAYVTYVREEHPHLELADTIDSLFTKLLGAPTKYVVQGWIGEPI